MSGRGLMPIALVKEVGVLCNSVALMSNTLALETRALRTTTTDSLKVTSQLPSQNGSCMRRVHAFVQYMAASAEEAEEDGRGCRTLITRFDKVTDCIAKVQNANMDTNTGALPT